VQHTPQHTHAPGVCARSPGVCARCVRQVCAPGVCARCVHQVCAPGHKQAQTQGARVRNEACCICARLCLPLSAGAGPARDRHGSLAPGVNLAHLQLGRGLAGEAAEAPPCQNQLSCVAAVELGADAPVGEAAQAPPPIFTCCPCLITPVGVNLVMHQCRLALLRREHEHKPPCCLLLCASVPHAYGI